jgi:hypothetical protein
MLAFLPGDRLLCAVAVRRVWLGYCFDSAFFAARSHALHVCGILPPMQRCDALRMRDPHLVHWLVIV